MLKQNINTDKPKQKQISRTKVFCEHCQCNISCKTYYAKVHIFTNKHLGNIMHTLHDKTKLETSFDMSLIEKILT